MSTAVTNFKRTVNHTKLSTPVYYVDLTLREEGVDLQSAIHTAREIDQQSKQVGSNQEALDQMARQGFANAKFEMDIEEGDVVEEFQVNNQDILISKSMDLKNSISDELMVAFSIVV